MRLHLHVQHLDERVLRELQEVTHTHTSRMSPFYWDFWEGHVVPVQRGPAYQSERNLLNTSHDSRPADSNLIRRGSRRPELRPRSGWGAPVLKVEALDLRIPSLQDLVNPIGESARATTRHRCMTIDGHCANFEWFPAA